jgi:ribosomal protein S4
LSREQSWSPANLFNLYQRTYGPPTADTKFTKSSLTMFQQKWKAKQLVRGYHGDWIPEQKFKKGYLPDGLPPIVGSKERQEARVPLASLMFAEVEKRLDTVVYRCCFAHSIYRARAMVVHGAVKLNGRKVRLLLYSSATASCLLRFPQVSDPNIKLQPGDLITVDPSAVSTLQPTKVRKAGASSSSPADSTDSATSPSASNLSKPAGRPLRFELPDFASPFLFIPPYIEPSFTTCSAIYLRHPTARPGISEIPTPYEADGEVMKLAWVRSFPSFYVLFAY